MKSTLLAIAYLIVSSSLIGQSTIDFITTWNTELTVNPTNTIEIRTNNGFSYYDYNVDWGDGSPIENHNGLNSSALHSYALPGIYQVRISNLFQFPLFGESAFKDNLVSIDQWGDMPWLNLSSSFDGCSNLQLLATDGPDFTTCPDIPLMFTNCTSLNSDISHWDVSQVENFIGMFKDATSFNQDLSSWDLSSADAMQFMFEGATSFDQDLGNYTLNPNIQLTAILSNSGLSTGNYDNTLIGWLNQGANVPQNVLFFGNGLKYCNSINERQSLIDDYGWAFQTDALDPNCPISDTDADGIIDDVDNCPQISNAGQEDLDLDGLGDVCDNDIDGDGFDNEIDCAPYDVTVYEEASCDDGNPLTIEDLITVDCICEGTLDTDGDDFFDYEDNCPLISNAGQEDLDMDGIGDVCDGDIDGDGVPGTVDCNDFDAAINYQVGDSCDDGDPSTVNDTVLGDCSCAGVIICYDVDKAALSAMYNSFDAPSLLNWDFTPGVPLDASWQGITMTLDGCHVEMLSLNQYLGGTLAPEVESLSQLLFLELTNSSIGGEIPISIGNISTLTQFQAYGNTFTGAIPESMWSLPLLEFLDLAGSNLSGLLPENAANTPALVELVLSDNNFSGCIPDSYLFFCDEYAELFGNDLINNDFDDYCFTGFGGCSDLDGDGILNENDNCANDPNTNQLDLDVDSIGDVCDLDIDGDGVLNDVDCDPLDASLYGGAACNDFDNSTIDDLIISDCTCQGTFLDTDTDGIADIEDNCPTTANADQADLDMDTIGDLCDNDIDGDGVLNIVDCAPTDPNIYLDAPCDDLNATTENDVIQADCSCQGTSIFDCPGLNANFGDPCDDGLITTGNDIILADCTCSGNLIINDNCNSPIDIVDGIYLNVQINGGGGASNICFNGGTDAIFFSYTATLTGITTVDSSIDPDEPDTRVSIYSGLCDSLNCIAQNDDISTADYGSYLTFNTTAGDTYIVEWDDRWSTDFFDFEISSSIIYDCQDLQANFGDTCDDGFSATVNDLINPDCSCSGTAINSTCTDAISISEGIVSGALISNGNGASNICQTNASHAIWYLYTASTDGECTITSEIDPNAVDTRITVFDGVCGASACLVFNDDIDVNAINYSSEVNFPVSAGDQFLIEWDDRWSSDAFDFEISVLPFDCPVLSGNIGDNCDDGDATTINDAITGSCTCVGVYSCAAADRITMEILYNGWDGPNTSLNWDFSEGSVVNNNWTGVTVNNLGCVLKIVLKSKGLNGIIDNAIGDLLSLERINIIRHPLLTGPVPSTIGDLDNLIVLNLQRNNLDRNLSSNLSNLSNTATLFNVKRNNITGCIPQSFTAFCGVIDVKLGNNPNWNNESFQAFCDFGTGGCVESIIEMDDNVSAENMIDKSILNGSDQRISALIYPNPNNGRGVNIKLNTTREESQNIELRVFDLYGKLILSDSFIMENETVNKRIEFNMQLSSGIYFVELLSKKEKLVKKLIIE